MKSLFRPFLGLLFVFVLAFGVAACGDDEESGSGSAESTPAATAEATGSATEEADAGGTAIQPIDGAEGTTIVVGSKNFDEQYILGEIYAQALEAAGYTVEKQLDLGAEQIAFRALRKGSVDAYPEYTGTALTSFYRVRTDDVPRDQQQAYDDMVEQLKKDNITGMPPTPFENTYRVASTTETAEQYDSPSTTSEVVEAAGNDVRLSGFPECRQRTDCLLGLNDTYDWDPEFVSSQGKYADLDNDQADFTMAFSTDGQLAGDKYVTYEDDKNLFPPYNVSLLVRDEVADKLGEEGVALIEQIQEPLDEEVMQQLNAAVSVDKQTPEEVATTYLQETGFIQ